ncbi:hypothetical protein C6P44_001993 [Monosporozyma unispora]|nr:hypothetical protein C6P44_001993 [Kazachstania unispora]
MSKDNNNIILDKIWYKLTASTSSNEYIPGSKFKDLICEMNELNDINILTPEQMESVINFSESNPEVKIYKFNIDHYLVNLLGFTFIEYLQLIHMNNDEEGKDDVDVYKAKYDTLKKEYEYLKNEQNNNGDISSKDYDIIIAEFKEQIKEQRELMLTISHNIENRDKYGSMRDKTLKDDVNPKRRTEGYMRRYNHVLNQIGKFVMILLISISIYLLISKYSKIYSINDNYDMFMDPIMEQREPWWSQYPILNDWIYKLQDWYFEITNSNSDNNNIFDTVYSAGSNDPFNEIKY